MNSLRAILLILAALLAPALAFAQTASDFSAFDNPIPATPTSDTKRPATIEGFRFGFGGFMPADSWCPIRIYISGNPTINSGAFGGTLTIAYAQDASQSARIDIPVATTPGRVTPFEALVAFPRALPTVRLTLRDESGRIVHERFMERLGLAGQPIPATLLDGVPVILALADRTGTEPAVARAFAAPDPATTPTNRLPGPTFGIFDPDAERPDMFNLIRRVVVRDEDLPESWIGYEGMTAIVATSDALAALSPAKAVALATWLKSGGRLVVLAQSGAQNWMRLLGSASGALEIDSPRDLPGCSEFRDVVARAVKQAREKKPPKAADGASKKNAPAAPAFLPDPLLAEYVRGRIIRISDPTRTPGWTVRWSAEDSSRTDGIPATGMLAEGPVGFGWAVVLGLDPAAMGANRPAISLAWRDALRGVMREADTRPFYPPTEWWTSRGSGPDAAARVAFRTLFNKLSDVPPIGDAAFVVIVICMIALALALGPLDGVILTIKRMRQWSWATALGWIGLAAVAAAAIPPLVRSGNSTSRVLRVVDALQSPESPGETWQTTLAALFSNSSDSVSFIDPGTDSVPARLWFRGISPVGLDERNPSDPLRYFCTTQSETRGPEPEPSGSAPGGRTNHPDSSVPLDMGQWTFRTLMMQGWASAVPSARLVRDGDAWNVTIRGTNTARVTGALRVGTEWLVLKDRAATGGQSTFRASIQNAADTGAEWNSIRKSVTSHSPEHDFSDQPFSVAMPLELPGPRERSLAIDARVDSGRWACVYLLCEEESPSVLARTSAGRGKPFDAKETVLYRILVPLPDAAVNHPPVRTPEASKEPAP